VCTELSSLSPQVVLCKRKIVHVFRKWDEKKVSFRVENVHKSPCCELEGSHLAVATRGFESHIL
jgi:hypothetical protein